MPYLSFFKKQQNLKFSSAANYMWHFIGLLSSGVIRSKAMVLLLLLVCCLLLLLLCVRCCVLFTILSAKSDSDVMFLQSYQ